MTLGIAFLALSYVLSQFFRVFLAVLVAPLKADLGLETDTLATASGLWFLSFAAMQIPVGWALDTIGPRRTSAYLFLIGAGGGAMLFAAATTALHIKAAMILIGIGCAPVLMACYYIFVRNHPPKQFATLAAAMIGVGTLGNVSASVPLSWTVDLVGWRVTMWLLAAICSAIALGIWRFVRDPEQVTGDVGGSVIDLLRIPALWLILPLMFVNYVPAAAIRGLWISPYLSDVFELSQAQIGRATLAMGLAMVVGVFAYGPLDRILGTRKWVIIGGNLIMATCLLALFANPAGNPAIAILLMCGVGLFGATYPVVIAHARTLFPAHLTGRGVTLMNLFGIGGVGLLQFGSGRMHTAATGAEPTTAYHSLFGSFAIIIVIGLIPYFFSRDRMD